MGNDLAKHGVEPGSDLRVTSDDAILGRAQGQVNGIGGRGRLGCKEQHRLLTTHPVFTGYAGEGGVDLRHAVSRAACLSLPEAEESAQAGLVALVIAEEGWDQNRGLEESLQWKSSLLRA